MIDIEREELLSFRRALELPGIRRIDGRTPKTTMKLRMWANRGVRGIRLETVMLGGVLYTSKEAVARFFAVTETARQERLEAAPAPPPRTRVQRQRASERAAKACAARGF
jgi:hypothetical protein